MSITEFADVTPIPVLCIGRPAPAGPDAAFGPWLWRSCTSLEAGLRALGGDSPPQAVLVDAQALPAASADTLMLATLARRCAVVVVADAPLRAQAWAWLRAGVQDVLARPRTDDGEIGRALALSVRRWQQQEDVRRAWSIDLDTGLPNRTQLMELLHQLCALREREPAPMALAVFRLDGLPACDALLGVAASPTLRRKLAVRLRAGLRASDVVAALGVDCFAVLLTRLDAPQDAQQVVGKLTRALQAPLTFAGQPVQIGVAAGVALHPLHAKQPAEMLELAQAAAGERTAAASARLGSRGEAANDG